MIIASTIDLLWIEVYIAALSNKTNQPLSFRCVETPWMAVKISGVNT